MLTRKPLARLVTAFAAYSFATCLLFWPVVSHVRTAVLFEPGDITSTARDYWAASEQGKTPFTLTKDRLIFAPQGQTRAPSLQIANPTQPLFVLVVKHGLGLLGALNAYMLLGFALSATAMFALLDRLRMGVLPSLFGGFVFGFNWWQYEEAFFGHIGLNHLWVFPLLLLALLGLRRSRTHRRAVAVGAMLALSFYVFSYLGLFACALAAVFALVDAFHDRDVSRLRTLGRHVEAWGVAGVLLLPPFVASRLISTGFSRSFVFTKEYFHGASLADYLVPPAHSPLFGRYFGAGQWPAPHIGEDTQFFGWTTLLLAAGGAALWLLRIRRGESPRLMLTVALWLIPVGVVCSLPAYATVAGRRIPLPSAAYIVGSITNWWKVYSRFGILVGLGLVVLAAFCLGRLVEWKPLLGSVAALALLTLVVIEMLPGWPAPTWDSATRSGASRWLEQHPGGIVAQYPMLQYWNPNALRSPDWPLYVWSTVYDQTHYRHPLYAVPSLPMDGSRTEAIRLLSMNLDDPSTSGVLRAENVRYVVVHDGAYRALGLPVPHLGAGYRSLAHLGTTRIVAPAAAPADIPTLLRTQAGEIESARGIGPAQIRFGNGFQGVESYFGVPSRWLIQDGLIRATSAETIVPTRWVFQMRGFSNRVLRHLVLRVRGGRALGSVDVAPSEQTYSIGPFTLPPGGVDLELHAEPGPQVLGTTDDRLASIYVEQPTIRPLAY